MFQGPKIIIFCATAVITNGVLIETIKHTSRIAEAVEYYDRVPQADLDSTSAVTPSVKMSIAEKAATSPTLLSEDVGAMKPVENEDEINSTRKTRVANSFDDAVGFPSPPAFRRTIDERRNNSSGVVEEVSHFNVTFEHQPQAAFSEHDDGLTKRDLEHSTREEREATLDGGPSVLPEEAYEDLKGGERIERLTNPSRSVRHIDCCRYRVPVQIHRPPMNSPCKCCFTQKTPLPSPKLTRPPTCPVTNPPACHTTYPATHPTRCPVFCSTATTPSQCCGRPATGTSSKTFCLPYHSATNNVRTLNPGVSCSTYSGTPAQGNFRTADPRNSKQQQRTTCCTAPRRKTFTCPATKAAPPTGPGTSGFMTCSGNGKGGNKVCSCINMIAGPSCTDPCSSQKACMFSGSGNGQGGNKVKSCINCINGGNMFCNSGQNGGGNRVQSYCNIIGGDCASLLGGSSGALLQSLCNMVMGPNSSLFRFNCPCGDDDCSEEDDPCCCQATTACPVNRCTSQNVYACSPVPSEPCYPQPTTYSCNPAPYQPSPPTSNYPPCIMLPDSTFYSCKKK